jgi:hypothetical protein
MRVLGVVGCAVASLACLAFVCVVLLGFVVSAIAAADKKEDPCQP